MPVLFCSLPVLFCSFFVLKLVKIDTEGCEVEILRSLPLQDTKAIFLEYHSRADAVTIRELLDREFALHPATGNARSSGEIGTFAFLRRS